MDKKIISKYRYKSVSKNDRTRSKDIRRKRNYTTIESLNSSINTSKDIKTNKKVSNQKRKTNKRVYNTRKNNDKFSVSILKIFTGIITLIFIAYISRRIYKAQSNNVKSVFSSKTNSQNLIANYDLKLGLTKIDNFNIGLTQNVAVNELYTYSKSPLIQINNDYSIKYVVASSITKQDDLNYEVVLNKNYKINSDSVSATIDAIKSFGTNNIYYTNVSNIQKIEKETDYSFRVKLTNADPYFVYNLNFPIYNATDFSNLNLYNLDNNNIINTNNPGGFKFDRNDSYSKDILNSIDLVSYDSSVNMVSDFRQNTIDAFLTSSYNDMQLIGKHEYGVKKYRNGESIFLFGNKNSNLFKQKEIRQALAYSIDRDSIIKNNIMLYSETIDIPYIYSDVKYKYDTIGANNIMTSNGWKKNGALYSKYLDGTSVVANLNLIVNKDDSLKSSIADNIQQMASQIGIQINVEKLSSQELQNRVQTSNYDLILTTVNINENPSIDYLNNYLDIDDTVDSAIKSLQVSNVENLAANIQNLENTLSSEVACIGILAKDTNIVYQKNITGFEDIGYFSLFKNIEKIGKTN